MQTDSDEGHKDNAMRCDVNEKSTEHDHQSPILKEGVRRRNVRDHPSPTSCCCFDGDMMLSNKFMFKKHRVQETFENVTEYEGLSINGKIQTFS